MKFPITPILILIVQLINNCFSYIITVDSHAEECFHDSGK